MRECLLRLPARWGAPAWEREGHFGTAKPADATRPRIYRGRSAGYGFVSYSQLSPDQLLPDHDAPLQLAPDHEAPLQLAPDQLAPDHVLEDQDAPLHDAPDQDAPFHVPSDQDSPFPAAAAQTDVSKALPKMSCSPLSSTPSSYT